MSSASSRSDEKLLRVVKKYLTEGDWRKNIHERQYTKAWFHQLEVLEAQRLSNGTGRLLWRFPVMPEYMMHLGSLAGGAQAAIHDICTSWAMVTVAKPGYWQSTGLTRNLNVTFYKPALEDEMLFLECEIVHAGRRLATIKGTLRRERDGVLISTSEHHKYNVDADSNAKL